jgi:hypothetical protein
LLSRGRLEKYSGNKVPYQVKGVIFDKIKCNQRNIVETTSMLSRGRLKKYPGNKVPYQVKGIKLKLIVDNVNNNIV